MNIAKTENKLVVIGKPAHASGCDFEFDLHSGCKHPTCANTWNASFGLVQWLITPHTTQSDWNLACIRCLAEYLRAPDSMLYSAS